MASLAPVTLTSSSSTQLLHHLFCRQRPPSSSVYLFLRPFCVSTIAQKPHYHREPRFRPLFASSSSSLSPSTSPFFYSHPLFPLPLRSLPATFYSYIHEPEEEEDNVPLPALSEEEEETGEDKELGYRLLSVHKNGDFDSEIVESDGSDAAVGILELGSGDRKVGRERKGKSRSLALKLSVREKKELASYAHSLGKKLKCQLVGKSGVTDAVVSSFEETLEKNELLKIKIHRTCPGELEEVVQHLEEATGSVMVGQIGRTVIVYRPSLTKLRAEEKRKEAQRTRKPLRLTPTSPKKEYASRPTGRGHRGASRVSTT